MFYAPGLLGYSAVKIASPTFYSLGDSRTPVIVSVASVAVNLALNIVLVRVMGFAAWRSAPRSRRCSMPARCCGCCGGRLGGLDGGRVAARLRQDCGRVDRDGASSPRVVARRLDTLMPGSGEAAASGAGRADHRRRARDAGRSRHGCCGSQEFTDATGAHRSPSAAGPPVIAALRSRLGLHPTVLLMASHPLHRGRLRQHLRAAAAAADSPARPVARRRRHADDAVPAGGVGVADRLRASRGSLAAAAAADDRADRRRSPC